MVPKEVDLGTDDKFDYCFYLCLLALRQASEFLSKPLHETDNELFLVSPERQIFQSGA